MADTLTDNSYLNTQRVINFSPTPQSFGGDSSFSLGGADTADVYKLVLNRSSGLVVTLSPTGGNADLELLNSGGQVISFSSNTGTTTDEIAINNLTAGTYYIRIHNDADSSSSPNYSFVVNTPVSSTDILWRNYSATNGDVVYWQMDRTNYLKTVPVIKLPDPNWKIETTGDFDSDGVTDLVWRNLTSGENRIWLMNSNNTIRVNAQLPTVAANSGWRVVGAADFTGEGKPDLLWRNSTNGSNVIWKMNGVNFQQILTLAPNIGTDGVVSTNWQIQGVGDFNKDGKADIVWRDSISGRNLIWYLNGANFSASADIIDVYGSNTVSDQSFRIEGVGDFNGDGNVDLLWRQYGGSGLTLVWFMQNNRQLGASNITQLGDPLWEIANAVTTTRTADIGGNTLSSAFNIGTISTASVSYTEHVGQTSDPVDFYKFKLSTNSGVKVGLSQFTGVVNLQLIHDKNENGVIDSGEIRVDLTGNSAQAATLISDNLLLEQTGTYYVRVVSTNPGGTLHNVSLSATAANLVNLTTVSPFKIFNSSGTGNEITEVTLSSSGKTTIQVEVQIKNTSAENAVNNVGVQFYVSRDAAITPELNGDFGLLDQLLSVNLAPGQTITRKVAVDLPIASSDLWSGSQTYYIGAYVDPFDEIAETNANDNSISKSLVIKGIQKPDVIGTDFKVKNPTNGQVISSAQPGQDIQITGSVKNQGNKAVASSFLVQYIVSKNSVIGDGIDDLVITGFVRMPETDLGINNTVTFDTNKTQATAAAGTGYLSGTGLTPPIKLPSLTDSSANAYWQTYGNGTYYIGMVLDLFATSGETGSGRQNNSNQGIGKDLAQITITGIS
jgi:hypothetical protein